MERQAKPSRDDFLQQYGRQISVASNYETARYSYKLKGDPVEIQKDIQQDILLNIARYYDRFNPNLSRPVTRIINIARNVGVTHFRKHHLHVARWNFTDIDAVFSLRVQHTHSAVRTPELKTNGSHDQLTRAIDREKRKDLCDCLKSMPKKYRQVLYRHYFLDMSMIDIAKEFTKETGVDVSPGLVRTMRSRAIKMLRWKMVLDKKLLDIKRQDLLAMSISILGLPHRVLRILAMNGIHSLGHLIHHTEKEILEIPSLSRTSLLKIMKALVRFNIKLNRMETENDKS